MISTETVMKKANRYGQIQTNPLSYAQREWTQACFRAVRAGLLRKERVNAGLYFFYPVKEASRKKGAEHGE